MCLCECVCARAGVARTHACVLGKVQRGCGRMFMRARMFMFVCVYACVWRGGVILMVVLNKVQIVLTRKCTHARTHARARTHTHTQNNHHRTEYFIYFTHVYDTDSTRTQNKTKQNQQNGVVYNQSGYHNIQLFSMHYTYTCQ